jgi:hypothetical protein
MIIKIQVFIFQLIRSFLSIIKIILLSDLFMNRIKIKRRHNEALILGNGPSLKHFFKKEMAFMENKTIFAVNYFARTAEYKKVKPEFYVITSPEYFLNEQKEDYANERIITLKTIFKETVWPMVLIIPLIAKKNIHWRSHLIDNKMIHVHYMNTTPVEGFENISFHLISRQLGMPRPHNVLIPTILHAINLDFRNIYMVGADHSWLSEIFVSKSNEVFLSQKHYYDDQTEKQNHSVNKPIPKPMYRGTSNEKRKLHEVLEKFAISFKSYWTLNEFAESKNIKIWNCTENSFIDAFEKKSIKDEK